jgi:hypothetical protein
MENLAIYSLIIKATGWFGTKFTGKFQRLHRVLLLLIYLWLMMHKEDLNYNVPDP